MNKNINMTVMSHNYVETSLLSAIQIYSMEKEHRMPHREFSHDTAKLLDEALSQINPSALQRLIVMVTPAPTPVQ